MKAIILALFVCVATVSATHAAAVPTNYESMLAEIFAKAKELEQFKEQLLQNYFEREPFMEVEIDRLLAHIETLKADHADCIEPVRGDISSILNTLFDESDVCMASTQASAGEITLDVAIVIAEILVDGYKLALLYKKCEAETDPVKQGLCFTRFSAKLLASVTDLVATIKNMVESSSQKFDAVVMAEDSCHQNANDRAMEKMQMVQEKIDTCIAKH